LLAVEVLAVQFAGGLGYGLGAAMTTGRADQIQAGVSAALAYYPATLLVAMIGGALLAVSSRLVILAWVLVLWAAIVAMLADTSNCRTGCGTCRRCSTPAGCRLRI
jgi:hypothetical protein